MLKKIFVFILLLVGAFLAYVATQPPEFLIARETVIKGSAEQIFPYLNNSQKSNDWMPWKEEDPEMKMTYSGPAEGVGSTSSWESPGRMGTGRAQIIESVPGEYVRTQLTYVKPMEMSQTAEMSLAAVPGGTKVRWSIAGQNNFVGRLFCTFMNMDRMVGGEFDKGLEKLKGMVEAA